MTQEKPRPDEIRAFYRPDDQLRATIGERVSYLVVKPVWSSPYRFPGRFLALLDGGDKEIAMVADPAELPSESWEAIREELRRRYLTFTILEVVEARMVFGSTYWTVVTDRGRTEFVTQSLQENAVWLSPTHLLLFDVDGNRYEVPDALSLPSESRRRLYGVV